MLPGNTVLRKVHSSSYYHVNLNDESMPPGNTVLRKVRTELLLITIMQT